MGYILKTASYNLVSRSFILKIPHKDSNFRVIKRRKGLQVSDLGCGSRKNFNPNPPNRTLDSESNQTLLQWFTSPSQNHKGVENSDWENLRNSAG